MKPSISTEDFTTSGDVKVKQHSWEFEAAHLAQHKNWGYWTTCDSEIFFYSNTLIAIKFFPRCLPMLRCW